MPVLKQWDAWSAVRPSRLEDNASSCYYNSYADQLVADTWLSLSPQDRRRFGPVMGGINPTDLGAVDHLQRMWAKYPGVWRAVGVVFCRHHVLSAQLESAEKPTIHHAAMKRIYGFCVEKHLPCLVHHDADKHAVCGADGRWEYVVEIEEVLHDFPALKLVWCQAGASPSAEPAQHIEMLDMMLAKYPNLYVSLSSHLWRSFVVFDGELGQLWSELLEKHSSRIMIATGDLEGGGLGNEPLGSAKDSLEQRLQPIWDLANHVSSETARAVLFDNAMRIWFEDWECAHFEDELGTRQHTSTMLDLSGGEDY